MKQKKLLGIFMILVACLILGYALYLQFHEEEASTTKITVPEKETEHQAETEPEEGDAESDTEQGASEEVVYPQEESELESMNCELVGMDEQVKSQILNYDLFLQTAKNWMLQNGFSDKNIESLNDVTMQYSVGKKRYLLMAEGTGESFYVIEDQEEGTYTTEKYFND